MAEIKLALEVSGTLYEESEDKSKVSFGWNSCHGAQKVEYSVRNFADLARARKLNKPYPTEGIVYTFSSVDNGGEPCKIIRTGIDQHSILSYVVQIVPGEDFSVYLPVDSLDKETLEELVVGNTMYVKMEPEDCDSEDSRKPDDESVFVVYRYGEDNESVRVLSAFKDEGKAAKMVAELAKSRGDNELYYYQKTDLN